MLSECIKDKIETKLLILKKMRLSDIGRASNLLWLCFGEDIIYKSNYGKTKTITEYSIHVQCTWRLIFDNNIILASGDIYEPSKKVLLQDDFNFEDFRYDISGNNLFDEKKESIRNEIVSKNVNVINICADNLGGLEIEFSNGYLIQIIPDRSIECEHWRFMNNKNNDHHFVVFN